jgi:hypothetical protein
LERYFVAKHFGVTVYLHRFVGVDPDEGCHNHPWNAAAVCLVGGYTEARMTTLCPIVGWREKYRTIRPGSINVIRKNDFHQIVKMQPDTWTLFVHGRNQAGWGFLRRLFCDYNLKTHGHRVEFHQPYQLSNKESPWWLNAPTGKHSDREPLQ